MKYELSKDVAIKFNMDHSDLIMNIINKKNDPNEVLWKEFQIGNDKQFLITDDGVNYIKTQLTTKKRNFVLNPNSNGYIAEYHDELFSQTHLTFWGKNKKENFMKTLNKFLSNFNIEFDQNEDYTYIEKFNVYVSYNDSFYKEGSNLIKVYKNKRDIENLDIFVEELNKII